PGPRPPPPGSRSPCRRATGGRGPGAPPRQARTTDDQALAAQPAARTGARLRHRVEPDGSGHGRRRRARRFAHPRAPPPGRAGRRGGNPGNPGGNPGTDGTFSGFLTAPTFATPLISLLIPKLTELPKNWKTFRLSPGLRYAGFAPPGFMSLCDGPTDPRAVSG